MRKSGVLAVLPALLGLAAIGWNAPARSVTFDCAKANLKVDFVICRSQLGMEAVTDLQAAWADLKAATPAEGKKALVRAEVQWMQDYAAACGVGGKGLAPGDPSGRTDACVVDRIRRRTAELRAMGGAVQPGFNGYDPAPQSGGGYAPQGGYAGYDAPVPNAGAGPQSSYAGNPAPQDERVYAQPAQPFGGAAVPLVPAVPGPLGALVKALGAPQQTYAPPPRYGGPTYGGQGSGGQPYGAPRYGEQGGYDPRIPPNYANLAPGYGDGAPNPDTPNAWNAPQPYGAPPVDTSASPGAAPYPAPATGQPTGAPGSPSLYPVDQLRRPARGLRPLRLGTFQGRPLFPSDDQSEFFRLVALGMKPGLIEATDGPDTMSDFARDFLMNDNPYHSLEGVDQFAAQEKRQQFVAAYGPALRAIAPRAPFEFVYRTDIDIPAFDPVKGGFSLPIPGVGGLPSGSVRFIGPSTLPGGFWKCSPGEARALFTRLQTENRANWRRAHIVEVFRAVAVDPDALTLELQVLDIAVYNASMTRVLYDFWQGASPAARRSDNAIAALGRPPAGLRPWMFPTLNGLPVFASERSRRAAFSSLPALSALSMMMAAASAPDEMERNGKTLAATFLTERAQTEVFDIDRSRAWKGENEFGPGAGKALFLKQYAPLIRQSAPLPPFRFVYAFETQLPTYDQQKSGFAIRFDSREPEGLIQQGGLNADVEFAWPDTFWKLSSSDAAAQYAALARNPSSYGRPDLRVAAEIEAVSLDPSTKTLRLELRSLKLYTADFSRVVHEFSVVGDSGPLASGSMPRALRLPAPIVFDEMAECAEAIAVFGAAAPEPLLRRCLGMVAARDASFYQQGGSSGALAANDARLPFFSRRGPDGSPAERAAFVGWAKSYAAGIPDTVTTAPVGPSGAEPNGDIAFPAVSRGLDVRKLSEATLEAEGLQPDQIVGYGRIEQTDIAIALPNRALSYGLAVPRSPQVAGATAQSVIRLGRPRILRAESGEPVILMDATPLRTVVTANGAVIAQRNYQDVARLDDRFDNPPPSGPRPAGRGLIRLDAPFIDLVLASTVGDKLSRRAMAHMVLRRWALENPVGYRGPRFFVVGKRAPDPQEAAALGPDFLAWAAASVPPLPLDVVTSGPIDLASEQHSVPWGALSCFGGSFDSLMQALNQNMAASGRIAECGRRDATLASDERRACAANQAIARTQDFLRPVGGECAPHDMSSVVVDPLTLSVRMDHDLPTPGLSLLTDRTRLVATVTLRLSGVEWSGDPPNAADVLPESIRGEPPEAAASRAAHDFVTLETAFVKADYIDPRRQTILASLGPDAGADVASIVRDYENAGREIDKSVQIPSTPYGPDLVGVRLGMSFDEAERIIRDHMQVANVYQGMRATDPKARAGFPKGFTSGKLFVSTDGREMVALIDEPPAAPGKVLAAWRRVLIEGGTVPPEETLAALKVKYGPPTGYAGLPGAAPLRPGSPINWHAPRGQRCEGAYMSGSNALLSDFWTDNGAPIAFPGAGPYQQPRAPMTPQPLVDPLGDSQARECGPFLTAYYLQGAQQGGGADTIDTMISDIDAYRGAFVQSRKMLQSAPPVPLSLYEGPYGPDVVGVRLGMTLDEAQAAMGQNFKVGQTYRIAAADQPGGAASLPGTGTMYVSEANDQFVAVFDAPHPGEGHVAAIWRRVYSPEAVGIALVTRRATEKYGAPAAQGESGRVLAWGSGQQMICGAADAQVFAARAPLDLRPSDGSGTPPTFRAANGETGLTVPMINPPPPAGIPTEGPGASAFACGPRVRLSFQPDLGDPAMNVTEVVLTDPGLPARVSQTAQAAASRAPVKF